MGLGRSGRWLGLIILKVVSNLDHFMIADVLTMIKLACLTKTQGWCEAKPGQHCLVKLA